MKKSFSFLFNAFKPLRLLLPRPAISLGGTAQQLSGNGFDFRRFEQTIGYTPGNWELFVQSLLHRSYLQFVDPRWKSNERLEFLGDAVLNAAVAEFLYQTFPRLEEGDLTKLRSRLVNRHILAQRAKELRISDFLLLSNSAVQSIDSGSESILADAFEAILGAIFLDGGIKPARKFVRRTLLSNQDVLASAQTDDNYKSALLEYAQRNSLGIPRYSVLKEEGPEHDRRFTIEVIVGNQSFGTGNGRSKKDAEQSAAAQALEKLQQSNTVPQP
ncbi:MAG TPA: ribonuclease III [Bacteroidota bacterium]